MNSKAEEISLKVEDGKEDELVEKIIELARGDLLYIANRLIEITVRYFQFRIREIVRRGFYFSYDTRVDYKDNEVIATLKVIIPEDIMKRYEEEYRKRAKYIKKLIRNARIRDRHYYETRSFEEILLDKESKNNIGEIVEPDSSRTKNNGSKEDT